MKIIAEAGCNWSTIEEAKLFIDKSKELNLFATKFQLYNEINLRDVKDLSTRKFLRSIMLDFDKAKELFEYGESIGQKVFFSCMFERAVDWCETIGVEVYKIRFKDNTNLPLIDKIIDTKKPFFISSNENIPKSYLDPLFYFKHLIKNQINLLCIPFYPAKLKEYTKKNIAYYQGYSDHSKGTNLLKIAIKYGIEYFEKHICLTKDCLESDWSVTFEQLAEVIR